MQSPKILAFILDGWFRELRNKYKKTTINPKGTHISKRPVFVFAENIGTIAVLIRK
jgi:hypothetical protein